MAGLLAASFFSSDPNKNFVVPGETVTFKFTDPLVTASNVTVTVLESVTFLNSLNAAVTDRLIGGFQGQLNKGSLTVQKVIGAPLPPVRDPVVIRVAANDTPSSPHLFAHMPEPEQIQSHTLRLRVTGTVNGRNETFEGTSLLQMEYPMSMIIGTVPPQAHDPSFAVVGSWARQQWQAHKPKFRFIQQVTPLRLNRAIKDSDYNELITAFVAAAQKSTSGVVALAVGHGDGGQSQPNGVPWCNLAPEDFAPPIAPVPFRYSLDIDDTVLGDGANKLSFPTAPDTLVKLRMMDRLGDALAPTGIRRILLHTCKAGGNQRFMQLFADRVRVPLLAHTVAVEYTGFANSGNITAHYEHDSPQTPRDLRHWPVSKVAGPFFPGPPPKRF